MSMLQRLYDRAPVAVQTVCLNAYALARARKRFGPLFRRALVEIGQLRHLSADELENLQRAKLRALLEHAWRNVPYYRDLPVTFRDQPLETAVTDLLAPLPVLSKAQVRAAGDLLHARGTRAVWITETSGSTGTPLTISLDAWAYQLSMALVTDHEMQRGVSRTDRRATFAGRLLQPVARNTPPFWRHNLVEHQMLYSTYHMTDVNLPGYLASLEAFRPAELIGYPSALYALADYCRRSSARPSLPLKTIITNSESLLDWQREALEDVFGVPVADYYGTAESVVFAAQCIHGRYHPDPLIGVWELLEIESDDRLAVEDGAIGRLVCTTLSNFAMPLVRYDTGDIVTAASGPCPCGRAGSSWHAITGRVDDVIVTPDGRPIGRLDHVFKGMVGVREAQIAQTAADVVEVRVVADKAVWRADQERVLRANMAERLGPLVTVVIRQVAEIPRTRRGKFRSVVQEFRSSHRPVEIP